MIFQVVVSGVRRSVDVYAHETLEAFIRKTLRESGNVSPWYSGWELRTADGTLLSPWARAGEAGLADNALLFLAPRAGVGA